MEFVFILLLLLFRFRQIRFIFLFVLFMSYYYTAILNNIYFYTIDMISTIIKMVLSKIYLYLYYYNTNCIE